MRSAPESFTQTRPASISRFSAVAAGRRMPNDRIRVDSVGVREQPGADGKMQGVLAVLVRTTQGCERYTAAAWQGAGIGLKFLNLICAREVAGQGRFGDRVHRGSPCLS